MVERVPVREEFLEPWHEIIARDNRNFPGVQACLCEDIFCRLSAGVWIHAPGVGDNLEVRLIGQDGSKATEDIDEVGRVPGLRIPGFLDSQDRHGEFSEVFEREIVEPTGGSQSYGRIEVIAPESA